MDTIRLIVGIMTIACTFILTSICIGLTYKTLRQNRKYAKANSPCLGCRLLGHCTKTKYKWDKVNHCHTIDWSECTPLYRFFGRRTS